MKRIYIGLDDTDNKHSDRGTGKLARWFKNRIPEGIQLEGIIRQQLPQLEGIPFTSKNSSACIILSAPNLEVIPNLIDEGAAHIKEHYIEGSDPGLCVAWESESLGFSNLIDFGKTCSSQIVTQKDALQAANGFHLSGHGGTNDGIIGAAAAIGLTIYGWSGRYIELEGMRQLPETATVGTLEQLGIAVLPLERNALIPKADDLVETNGKLRPRRWGSRPAISVIQGDNQKWQVVGQKTSGSAPAVDRLAG